VRQKGIGRINERYSIEKGGLCEETGANGDPMYEQDRAKGIGMVVAEQ